MGCPYPRSSAPGPSTDPAPVPCYRPHLGCATSAPAPAPGDPEPPTPDELLVVLTTAAGSSVGRGGTSPHRLPPRRPPPLSFPRRARTHPSLGASPHPPPDELPLATRLLARQQTVASAVAAGAPPPAYATPADPSPSVARVAAAATAASSTAGESSSAITMMRWTCLPTERTAEVTTNAALPERIAGTALSPAAVAFPSPRRPLWAQRPPMPQDECETPKRDPTWRDSLAAVTNAVAANVPAADNGGGVVATGAPTYVWGGRALPHFPAQSGAATTSAGFSIDGGDYPVVGDARTGGGVIMSSASATALATSAAKATASSAAAVAATATRRGERAGAPVTSPITLRSTGRAVGVGSSTPPPSPLTLACPRDGCTFATRRRSQLTRHHNRVHLRLKPHACGVCGRWFASRSDRKKHVEAHHGRVEVKERM